MTSSKAINRWATLVVVCLAQFMVVLDATIVNIALPSIRTDLNFSDSGLQWVINSYTLVFGGFLLLGGRLADLIGRRILFVIGLVVFSIASLCNGLATDDSALIIFRGLQGFGGALISPAALSIITTTFDDGPDRAKALGVWSAIAAGGGAFGLLLGGVLVEYLTWPWVFYVNVPVGLLTVLAAYKWVPESRIEVERRHFDVGGAIVVTGGLMLLVYAIVGIKDNGWSSFHTWGLSLIAVILLGIFILIEAKHPAPLVRLGLLKMRSLALANLTMFVVAGGLFSMFYFATLYVQHPDLLGYGPLKAGLAFLPVTFGIGAGAGVAQQLMKKVGVKVVSMLGLTVAACGLGVLAATAGVDGTYAGLLGGLLPMSIGMGLTFVPLTLVATTAVSDDEAGAASGIFNTAQQIGGSLGLAVLVTVAINATKNYKGAPGSAEALVRGYQYGFTASVGLMALGLLMIVLFLRKKDVEGIDVTASMAAH